VIFFVTRESRWKGVDPLYASVKVNAEEGVVDFTEYSDRLSPGVLLILYEGLAELLRVCE
jgi:hypothetical protein